MAKRDPVLRLVSLIKERKVNTFEGLCDKMGISPSVARKLIIEARERKFAIDVAGEDVGIRPTMPNDEVVSVRISKTSSIGMFGVCSDLHFGSKYHLRSRLEDFVGDAYGEGARLIFLPGDLLDGCYRHGKWELTHHGFQEQVAEFREGLPRKSGLRYVGITGNHDQTFENESGMIVHEAINEHFAAHGRHDLQLLGARGAYVRLHTGKERGVFVEMWHPLKGPAYALSYKLQKHVEGYAPGQKPDFLFTGHWHQSTYVPVRGVHAYSSGTFQGGGSSFGKSLGGAPSIGGWIIRYGLTPEGTVRDVTSQWKNYYETEQVREVRLG